MWSSQQEAALKAVDKWLRSKNEQVFKVFGFAGTGKTTLAKHFAASLGPDANVVFGAYTGKAALVLQKNGCTNAMTIHRMIYIPRDKGKIRLLELREQLDKLLTTQNPTRETEIYIQQTEMFIKDEEENLSRPAFTLNHEGPASDAHLIIIDECSMVDKYIGEDLLSFGVPILVLGDPAQLPPVGGGGYFTNGKPDVMLTEIHRQAEGSPIIALATQVREGKTLELGTYGTSVVLPPGRLEPEVPLAHDQILVGRNATRHHVNRRMRSLLGLEGESPVEGDKVVCLRNNHQLGLLNGGIWTVKQCLTENDTLEDNRLLLVVDDGDGTTIALEAWANFFGQQPPTMPWWEQKEAQAFDFGYALTTHKAQGSQWESVLVFDESAAFRDDKNRWLYTAITRAADRVTIVQMD